MTASADTLDIRPLASAEEAEECARLMSSSEPWVTLGRTYEASLEIVRDPAREAYVAYSDEQLVGLLIINMRGAFTGYIQTVLVHPAWQGRRIGTALVRWAEQRIFRESPNVFMCVSSFNRDAYRLYERLGYSVVGELTDYIVRGHSEILLRKSAGPLEEFRTRQRGAPPDVSSS